MGSKKSIRKILFLLAAAVTIWMNSKYQLIVLSLDDMVNYQFNLFTVSSGLAGFSFTTLGVLLGMGSEVFIEKLKDTEIVTSKCRTIAQSLFFLCTACVAALYFIVGFHTVVDRICLKIFKNKFDIINESVYLIEILCLFIGLLYFIISVYNVFDLVKRVYGFKTKDYNKVKDMFMNELEQASQRQHEGENRKKEEDKDFLEK